MGTLMVAFPVSLEGLAQCVVVGSGPVGGEAVSGTYVTINKWREMPTLRVSLIQDSKQIICVNTTLKTGCLILLYILAGPHAVRAARYLLSFLIGIST